MARKTLVIRMGLAQKVGPEDIPALRIVADRVAHGGKLTMEREANAVVDALYYTLPAHTLHRIFARLRHRLGLCEALGMSATCCADRTKGKDQPRRGSR